MKKIKLGFKKPEKVVELDKGSVLVAEHKGDINYLRYVKFKQLVPQFWERMDSPTFEVYFERIQDAFDKGKPSKALMLLKDYQLAIKLTEKDNDAWGLCFALICYEKDENIDFVPTDVELKDKLNRLAKAGVTPEIIKTSVVNFMKASPETFQDHLILLDLKDTMIETGL